MSEIDPQGLIDESELELSFIRADGPGGQNVNKVATAVQLRFDLASTESLPEEVKKRLRKLAGKRITQDSVLVIEAKRFRTQEKNRADALARFYSLVHKAFETPKKRKRTKPSAAAIEKRLEKKRQRGEKKRSRQKHLLEE